MSKRRKKKQRNKDRYYPPKRHSFGMFWIPPDANVTGFVTWDVVTATPACVAARRHR